MSDDQPDPDVRARLRELEDEIANLRAERDGVRDQIGAPDGGEDAEDRAAALTNLEEQDALLAALEERRTTLLEQLPPD